MKNLTAFEIKNENLEKKLEESSLSINYLERYIKRRSRSYFRDRRKWNLVSQFRKKKFRHNTEVFSLKLWKQDWKYKKTGKKGENVRAVIIMFTRLGLKTKI